MKILNRTTIFLFSIAFIFSACNKYDAPEEPQVENTAPIVTRYAPYQSFHNDTANGNIVLYFRFDDQEQLAKWSVYEQIDSVSNTKIYEETLFDNTQLRTFSYNVPASVPLGREIKLIAVVEDTKGMTDTTVFRVYRVLPQQITQPKYSMQSYVNDTIYSGLATNGKFNFSLLFNSNTVTNVPDIDIREVSSTAGTFSVSLSSPNNTGNSTPFMVITDPNVINYSEVYYDIVDAFYTSNFAAVTNTTGTLQVGNIVLLQMVQTAANGDPLYAVIHIKQVVDNAGDDDDYIVFDYKYAFE